MARRCRRVTSAASGSASNLGERLFGHEIEVSAEVCDVRGKRPAIIAPDPQRVEFGSRRVATGEGLATGVVIRARDDGLPVIAGIEHVVVQAKQEAITISACAVLRASSPVRTTTGTQVEGADLVRRQRHGADREHHPYRVGNKGRARPRGPRNRRRKEVPREADPVST